ncbi:MAG: arylsulfatase [Pedosphaera sp. Tous-C6FEB]|nr:MAG: arylsulfatase [Pedosphaera sp. Tous-C6FEB]
MQKLQTPSSQSQAPTIIGPKRLRLDAWCLAILWSVGLGIWGIAAAAAPAKPNIIYILSDDMGFSDLGCYGSEIATPHLDALAAGGLRFTQFYNTARCCPTRASLLTGLYPHQAGIGHMVDSKKSGPGYQGDLNRNCITIAQALKPAGYRNYIVGKWHVTPLTPDRQNPSKHNWPLQRGFDRFYGTIHGAGSFFDPNTLTRDNQFISPQADPEYRPAEYYYTDAISDHAVRFIREHAQQAADKPFFMYVAYTAAHWPMHAKQNDIAKYKGRYDGGYEPIRAARWAKAKQLGLVDPKWELTAASGAWAAVTDKAFETRCMEVYAAMVDCMDQGIGRIVAELKARGQFENTLICYLQDNGGCAEGMGRGTQRPATPRADQPTLPPLAKDYLQPDMIPKQTRDGYPMRQGYGVLPGGADTYHGYGREWANVSNTPFREYKHWVHEGGISTPLVAHWPKGISARGELRHQPGHLIDLMATAVDLAGAKYPTELDNERIAPMEGVSLRAAFENKPLPRTQPIFWEHEGNRAVREGDWKLVAKGPGGKWELYNLAADRTETRDLASTEPAKLKELIAQWETWAKRANAIPWPHQPQYGEAPADAPAKKGKKK